MADELVLAMVYPTCYSVDPHILRQLSNLNSQFNNNNNKKVKSLLVRFKLRVSHLRQAIMVYTYNVNMIDFTRCLEATNDLNTCSYYLDALKVSKASM